MVFSRSFLNAVGVNLPKSIKKPSKISNNLSNYIKIDVAQAFNEKETNKAKIIHKEWDKSDVRQKRLQYAYNLWWKDFVLTIITENWTMWIDRKSYVVWSNWYSDYGICQINIGFHPEVLSNWSNWKKFVDWFYDPYKQIDYCNKLFKWWTKFYWYNNRFKVQNKIDFK